MPQNTPMRPFRKLYLGNHTRFQPYIVIHLIGSHPFAPVTLLTVWQVLNGHVAALIG